MLTLIVPATQLENKLETWREHDLALQEEEEAEDRRLEAEAARQAAEYADVDGVPTEGVQPPPPHPTPAPNKAFFRVACRPSSIWCMGISGPKTSDHFACCAVAQKPRGPPNQASCPQ